MSITDSKKGVVVYCGSSSQLDKKYVDAAYSLGQALTKAGVPLVSGGGRGGLMAAAIDGALSEGGDTVGVLPDFMVERGWNHPNLTEMIVTDSMHTRKATMAQMSCAAIALPGGCGTFDELFEIITWRQLGLYQGNVVILNVDHYYDPLIEMLERMMQEHFMNPDHANLWHIASSVEDAVAHALRPIEIRPFSQKLPIEKY